LSRDLQFSKETEKERETPGVPSEEELVGEDEEGVDDVDGEAPRLSWATSATCGGAGALDVTVSQTATSPNSGISCARFAKDVEEATGATCREVILTMSASDGVCASGVSWTVTVGFGALERRIHGVAFGMMMMGGTAFLGTLVWLGWHRCRLI
jgi:hypothetical protein